MRYTIGLLLLFGFINLNAQETQCDTITDFSNPACNKAVFKSPSGKHYKVAFESDTKDGEHGLGEFVSCLDSVFTGKARAASKTVYVDKPAEDFATVSALLNALPKDAAIRLKVANNQKRVAEEQRNVRLAKDTYLYAFKKESDNDYHVIIGDHKDFKKATFFNVEISGLSSSNDKRFQSVRAAFEKQFVKVCNNAYAIFSANPIKIQIEGSLFYDIDHKPGQIGPAGFQPATTWEIHPISKIVFLK